MIRALLTRLLRRRQAAARPAELPLVLHHARGARRCLVTFGSRINPGRKSSFAFQNTIKRLAGREPFDWLLVRPLSNNWYLDGIPGLGDTAEEAAEALRRRLAAYDTVVFTGNSMGGYAALRYAVQCPATRCVAFSPQTDLSAAFRASIGDGRWQEDFAALQHAENLAGSAIAGILRATPGAAPEITVHVGEGDPRDVAYAAALEADARVRVVRHGGQDHDLVHALRASGALDELIAEALGV